MNKTAESIKKIGAGLLIIILAIMMGIMFSTQDISEITKILSGEDQVGSFQGKEISSRIYLLARNQCKRRYQAYGDVPEFLISNCVNDEVQSLYAIPSIGEKLGVKVSERLVKNQIMEAVRYQFEQQQEYADTDDHLSMKEIYNREIQYNPEDVRERIANTQAVVEVFKKFPYPEAMSIADLNAHQDRVSLNVIMYNNARLLKILDNKVTVTAEEVRAEYDKRQAEAKTEEDKKPFDKLKKLIAAQLKTENKQKKLSEVKSKLSELGDGPALNKVSEITGVAPEKRDNVELDRLAQMNFYGEKVNLALPALLVHLGDAHKKSIIGPLQAGENTVYVEILDVKKSSKEPVAEELAQYQTQQEQYMASYLLQQLVKHEVEKGNFTLRKE